MRCFRFLEISATLVLLSSCGASLTRFSIDVDAISSPLASGKSTYILIPGNTEVAITDLQFQEYAGYLVSALDSQGFEIAETFDQADLVITLSYGIGDPQTNTYTTAIPVFGQTGVASSTTTGTATTIGNRTNINTTTTNNPTFGITGYTTGTRTETTFYRYAQVIAFDYEVFQREQEALELWRTTTTSTGSSGDLRRVFPVMMGAAAQYLGQNSTQRQNVVLTESANEVLMVKGLLDTE